VVSNIDRICTEIKKEAGTVAPAHDLDAGLLFSLVMEIVDIEDQNRKVTVPRINQTVENKIHEVAIAQMNGRDY
jgi:hypothetical protein